MQHNIRSVQRSLWLTAIVLIFFGMLQSNQAEPSSSRRAIQLEGHRDFIVASKSKMRAFGSFVRFDWLDGFGNKTNWNSKSFPNPQSFGVRLGYTDELIGVERRPAVSAGYAREAKDITKPELAIMFDLM